MVVERYRSRQQLLGDQGRWMSIAGSEFNVVSQSVPVSFRSSFALVTVRRTDWRCAGLRRSMRQPGVTET